MPAGDGAGSLSDFSVGQVHPLGVAGQAAQDLQARSATGMPSFEDGRSELESPPADQSGMKYLIDACTVSDFVKGRPQVLARIKALPPDLLGVSVLTPLEVAYGLALNPNRSVPTMS